MVERGFSYVDAARKASTLNGHHEGFYIWRQSKQSDKRMCILAVLDPGRANDRRSKDDKLYR